MTPDYAKWPVEGDVLRRLKSVGVELRDQGEPLRRIAETLPSIIQHVQQTTKRQFAPDTEDTIRFYDGTDTPELEVDEMVSLTGVQAIVWGPSANYSLTGAHLVQAEIGKARTRLLINAGASMGYPSAFGLASQYYVFPAGRQNIQVTGKFGYAATIPADLWDAVCGEAAARLVSESLFTPEGRLKSWSEAGVSESYDLPDGATEKVLPWRDQFTQTLLRYKKSQGKRLRRLRGEML